MTIVVAGANGLVGSRVVARLSGAGERVVALGRGPRRVEGAFEYVEVDLLRAPEKLWELMGRMRPAGVINAAAMTDVDACEQSPLDAWALNVRAVEVAASACAQGGARPSTRSTHFAAGGANAGY